MEKPPLTRYVAAVIVVLIIVVGIIWLIKGKASAKTMAVFAGGYLIGMLAMYIAMHFYRHK